MHKSYEEEFTDRLLRINAVCKKVELAEPTIYKHVAAGGFPPPLKLTTRASRWLESDIDAWIKKKRAEAGL